MLTLAAFIIAIGVLVTFHEFGHFIAAYLCGVKILVFSVGFGKPLYQKSFGKDRTIFQIAAVPLGGYVQMFGENSSENVMDSVDQNRSFARQSVWKRMLIVAAGPIFNFVLAIFFYWVIALTGVLEPQSVFSEPDRGTPAYEAGIIAHDKAVELDGRKAGDIESLQYALIEALGKDSAELVIERGGTQHSLTLNLSRLTLNEDILAQSGFKFMPGELSVESVDADSPAQLAGLGPGDKIVSVNGRDPFEKPNFFETIRESRGAPVTLDVKTASGQTRQVTLSAVLKQTDEEQRYLIGVRIHLEPYLSKVELGVFDGANYAWTRFSQVLGATFSALAGLIDGSVGVKSLSGPITIADYAGRSLALGLSFYLSFLALISVNLGLFNLLPIPLLDGGHLVYYCVEAVRGRALSEKTLKILQYAGITIILVLTVVAFGNDIARLFQ